MLESKQRVIDGLKFRVSQLECEKAEDLLADMFKLLGPTGAAFLGQLELKQVAEGPAGALADTKLDSPGILAAMRELADRLDTQVYHRMCRELAQVTFVQMGDAWPKLSDVSAEIFAGKLTRKWKWFAFALEVQFSDFLSGLGASIKRRVAELLADLSPSDSPPVSDGASGDSPPTSASATG